MTVDSSESKQTQYCGVPHLYYNWLLLMGLFGTLWRGFSTVTRTTVYLGGFYTFLAYFYVQQIKYRLKDTVQCKKMHQEMFIRDYGSVGAESEFDPLAIKLGLAFGSIYTFYYRAWNFREYEELCKKFHKNVVKTILKNYESYGIFNLKEQMEKEMSSNNINPAILGKIQEVKEVNQQITAAAAEQYMQIVEKQLMMHTGTILGLTDQERGKINFIYRYMEKGLYIVNGNNENYWEYKLMQTELKRHQFNDAIFQLMYI